MFSSDNKNNRMIPNSTQMPNVMLDEWLAALSGSEWKVVCYIARHTYGFGKDADSISQSQLLQGIRKRDGTHLDHGTGLSEKTLKKAIDALLDQGKIERERRRSTDRGNEPTVYRLVLTQEGRAGSPEPDERTSDQEAAGEITPPFQEKLREGVGGEIPGSPSRRNYPPQNQGVQNQLEQNQFLISNGFEKQTLDIKRDDFAFSRKRASQNQNSESTGEKQQPDPDRTPRRSASRGAVPVGEVLAARYPNPRQEVPPEATKRSRSGVSGQSRVESRPGGEQTPKSQRGRPPKAPESIAALIEEFSGEFHDGEHTRSNVGQAARLWKASGLAEAAFCQAMYDARSTTKQYDITKRATGDAGTWGLRNKMPYFFEVLRDKLGMRDEQPRSSGPAPNP
jgi:hypothetical protein